MRPIRGYLYTKDAYGDWTCAAFREFEPIEEAALNANQQGFAASVIHIGIWRPDTAKISTVAENFPGRTLLSPSAIAGIDPSIKVSRLPVANIEVLDFYLALDGFGYSIQDPTKNSDQDPCTTVNQVVNETADLSAHEPEGWVKDLIKINSAWTSKLIAVGIWNESTYRLNEWLLDENDRFQIGLNRYVLLTGSEPNPESLLDNIEACPPWLTQADLRLAELSVRSGNVFKAHSIKFVGDLAAFQIKGLLKLPNMGLKSLREVSTAIIELFLNGAPLLSDGSNSKVALSLASLHAKKISRVSSNDVQSLPPTEAPTKSQNIFAGFSSVSDSLAEEDRDIWHARLGIGAQPMNLAQIAERINKSREGVRQIETKIYRKIASHFFWNELNERVLKHLTGRTSPLLLEGISAIDPWFEGSEKLTHALKEVCKHVTALQFSILTIDETPVLSRISQAAWHGICVDAKLMLEKISDLGLTEEIVKVQIQGLLSGLGHDLNEPLWEKVSTLGIWVKEPNGPRKLVGFGQTSASLVMAIMNASDSPLRCDEIFKRVEESGPGNNFQSIKNAVMENGYLLGRGLYGLRKHCPLDEGELETIRTEVENIFACNDPAKQWHSDELVDEIQNSGFNFEGRLDKYNIFFALEKSDSITYLGRMVWVSKDHTRQTADSRLDVRQAIISLLESAGHPLTSSEIKKRLNADRGVNVYFQIFPNKPLIRIRPGVWGLFPRDVTILDSDKKIHDLLSELSARQEGMHSSEIAKFLGLSNEDDVSLIVCLGQESGLKFDKGQYCYLEAWGTSRRVSIMESVEKALDSFPDGITLSRLHNIAEKETKRPIQRTLISTMLQHIDAEFDASNMLWKRSGQSNEEDVSI